MSAPAPAHAPDADAARARFAAAIDEHLRAPLPGDVTIRHCPRAEASAAADRMWADDPRPAGKLDALYSDEQRARLADLAAAFGTPLGHDLVLEHGGEIVGSYFGQQESWGRYYMINTIVRRDWQGRGLYRALLARVVAAAQASGFSEITSRHRADNNAILIAKLKGGFSIAGFEVAPRFGVLVHLRKYLVEGLAHAFEHRIDGRHREEMQRRGVIK